MCAAIEYAYRRFSRQRFPLPTESQLVELEQRIGVTLPLDYRRFLLDYNGGYFNWPEIHPNDPDCPDDVLTYLHGIRAPDKDAALGTQSDLNLFEENTPPKILPIGYTMMGSLIVLVTQADSAGTILFKKAFGDFYYLAEGIEEFFTLLREPAT